MKEILNIIIFSDFAVFSSFSKKDTLDLLRKSILLLDRYDGPFPMSCDERILISVSNIDSPISKISIQSSMYLNFTIDVLERVTDLLESNEVDFFCPNETC